VDYNCPGWWTTIVLTGGQAWSWSALIVLWLVDVHYNCPGWWTTIVLADGLQLSWLVERHGVGLLTLSFDWLMSTTIVLTGGQAWSWSALIVLWLVDVHYNCPGWWTTIVLAGGLQLSWLVERH
jgi:hypothetical protein